MKQRAILFYDEFRVLVQTDESLGFRPLVDYLISERDDKNPYQTNLH